MQVLGFLFYHKITQNLQSKYRLHAKKLYNIIKIYQVINKNVEYTSKMLK